MSKRLLRVNQLLKKELSNIIFREVEFPEGVLVTLTRVECADNLSEAGVYVSVFPQDRIKQALLILNKLIYRLQQLLNKRLKMRPIPRIQFVEEKKIAEAGRVEELLEEIHDKEISNTKAQMPNQIQNPNFKKFLI